MQEDKRTVVVTTLPVTPKFNRGLGSFTTVFVADMFNRWVGGRLFTPVNLISRIKKYRRSEADVDSARYYDILMKLGIVPVRTWRDDDPDFQERIKSIIEFFRVEGILTPRCISLLSCPCGAIEIPSDHLLTLYNSKLVENLSGQNPVCRKCSNSLKEVQMMVIKLDTSAVYERELSCTPSFWEKEVRNLFAGFPKKEIIISKRAVIEETKELLGVTFSEETYYLDPVFRWSQFLSGLDDVDDVVIVTGSRTVPYAVLSVWYAGIISPRINFSLLVHPSITFKDDKGTMRATTEELLDRYSRGEIRTLLGVGMTWGKESIIDSSLLYLIGHSIAPPKLLLNSELPEKRSKDLILSGSRSFIRWFNTKKVKELITRVRRGHQITQSDLQLLSALLA